MFYGEVFRQSDGWRYEKLGIWEHQSFNLPHWLFNVKIYIFGTICPIFYDCVLSVVFIYLFDSPLITLSIWSYNSGILFLTTSQTIE